MTSPKLSCLNCGKQFCGGLTRIKQHICKDCTCETNAFLDLKGKLLDAQDAEYQILSGFQNSV